MKKLYFLSIICYLLLVIFLFSSCSISKNATTTTTTAQTTEEETENSNDDVSYISDRSVYYYEEDEQYVVFFGIQDSSKNYISTTGEATIIIEDSSSNELFNKTIEFDSSDFTDWSNQMQDNSRYLCGLYIDRSDISGGVSSSGTLKLSVSGDSYFFDEESLKITELPNKGLSIELPSLPQKIKNYEFDDEVDYIVNVTKITYESNMGYNGDSASVEFNFEVDMEYNINGSSSSDYTEIGYKLYNSKHSIVESGTVLVSPMQVGDTVEENELIFDLDPNDKYTLELIDVK